MMDEPTKIIETLVTDRNIVYQFFGFFSRFEYALKRRGYLKPGKKANPNWEEYANSIQGRFRRVKDTDFSKAINLFLKEPPKTQVVSGNNLTWVDTIQGPGEHEEHYILRLVRTVRNNLFHGGKFPIPIGPLADVARNQKLLEAGITVLRQCLEFSPDVSSAFREIVK